MGMAPFGQFYKRGIFNPIVFYLSCCKLIGLSLLNCESGVQDPLLKIASLVVAILAYIWIGPGGQRVCSCIPSFNLIN